MNNDALMSARPMISEIVSDTKTLLQQSRERMIITSVSRFFQPTVKLIQFSRLASDISDFDASCYSLTLPSSSTSPVSRYHVGEPIRVSWTAPSKHSRKDWIGIYRYGSCKSQLVTRISSLGKWMPIYEEEWDGDKPVTPDGKSPHVHAGELVFRGKQLPWVPGRYELRYHHDGKHNVMSRVAPVDIFGG